MIVCPKQALLTTLNEFPDIEAQMRKMAQFRADQFAKRIEEIENQNGELSPTRPNQKLKTLLHATEYIVKLRSWHKASSNIQESPNMKQKPLRKSSKRPIPTTPSEVGIDNSKLDGQSKKKHSKENQKKTRLSFLSWSKLGIKSVIDKDGEVEKVYFVYAN